MLLEYLHTANTFYSSKRFLHYAMATREKTKLVSLRQNRDYIHILYGHTNLTATFIIVILKLEKTPKLVI